MEFYDVIKNRYSCKKYKSDEIDEKKLNAILEAGNAAPTAKNLQEHKIYVIKSKEMLEKIDTLTPCRYNAPVVLAFAYDTNNTFIYPGEKYSSGAEDVTIVATHIVLAAANEGVDSCWLNKFDPDETAKALNLPENEKLVLLMDLGYAADDAEPLPNHFKRKDLSEIVEYK